MAFLTLNDNQQLYYSRIAGADQQNTSLPVLVFLHEGLGCHAMWKGFPEALCQQTGCPGLVYDRIGYGQSSPLPRERTVHYMHDYATLFHPPPYHVLMIDEFQFMQNLSRYDSFAHDCI